MGDSILCNSFYGVAARECLTTYSYGDINLDYGIVSEIEKELVNELVRLLSTNNKDDKIKPKKTMKYIEFK